MLDIPEDLQKLLDLISRTKDDKAKGFAYKLLWSMIQRYNFRWEYFVC